MSDQTIAIVVAVIAFLVLRMQVRMQPTVEGYITKQEHKAPGYHISILMWVVCCFLIIAGLGTIGQHVLS